MISKEEKLLVMMKHQPYLQESLLREYVEMYTQGDTWAPVPIIVGKTGLRQATFTEYVDWIILGQPEEWRPLAQ
jgi:hypothetical protein